MRDVFKALLSFKEHFKILIFLDERARLDNDYMNVWRITNNIDALRDIFIDGEQICIDATSKSELENYPRKWPDETNCTHSVINELIKKGLLENDLKFFEKYEIFG